MHATPGAATRRCACVDVGSNTTALLVADVSDVGLTPIATERHFTLLGETPPGELIQEAKILAVEAAVADLVETAREHDTTSIELIATHIVREAANGADLCSRVEQRVGIPLRMIDGHTEARYSCIGATGGLSRIRHTTVVIDAGGGSTEISVCRPGADPITASFQIGSARLHREYLFDDPPTPEQLTAARAHTVDVFNDFETPDDVAMVLAVGGGATTAQKLMGGVIDPDGVRRVMQLCLASPAADLAASLGLEPQRAALLPASLVVLGVLAEKLGVTLEVGRGGMREGALLALYEATSPPARG